MILKYIIFDNGYPVLFCAGVGHDKISLSGMKPTSAGFARIIKTGTGVDVVVRGRSIALDIASRPEDADIIRTMTDEKTLRSLIEEVSHG